MHGKKDDCVVGLGEILWDLLPQGKQLGGAPANFTYHAQILGATGFPVSAVGNDILGMEIRKKLKTKGLDDRYVSVLDNRSTGTVSVKLDEQGVPDFTIHKNVAWDYIPWSDTLQDLARKADVVCFGSLAQRSECSRSTIIQFLRQTRHDCLRILDVNLRQNYHTAGILKYALGVADILKLNEDELPVIASYFDLRGSELDMITALIETNNLRMVVLTKGAGGSLLQTESDVSELAAPAVAVVDTVGAGDAFTAAVAVGILKGLPLKLLHQRANKLSAFVCTQKGAMPSLSEKLLQEILL